MGKPEISAVKYMNFLYLHIKVTSMKTSASIFRNTSLIVFFLTAFTTLASAQDLHGTWNGSLDLGVQKLAIVFHIQKDDAGNDVCTMDSPDQGAKGIRAVLDFLSGDSLSVRVPQIGMTYSGKASSVMIYGTFSQNGMKLPLNLMMGDVLRLRPQTPTAPFSYKTEDVVFENKAGASTLAGTLSWPVGYRPGDAVPVVLLVTGSGLEDRNEEIFSHKPFLVIADYLARNGIASLRYDDRGFGKSTGDPTKATTVDFAQDAFAGISYLRSLGRFSSVGILGHSEGASIAFMAGARKLVDFVISMAGVGVKGDVALSAQVNRICELSLQKAEMTPEQYSANAIESGNPWLIYFVGYDPSSDISHTECPVMAINGSKDTQVLSDLNLTAIRKLLMANDKDMVKEYPGLNHLFQPCTTGLPTEYPDIITTISTEVLKDMAGWINAQKRSRP
jgi:pimeloyl-ACP methyl ester carboxylesterase